MLEGSFYSACQLPPLPENNGTLCAKKLQENECGLLRLPTPDTHGRAECQYLSGGCSNHMFSTDSIRFIRIESRETTGGGPRFLQGCSPFVIVYRPSSGLDLSTGAWLEIREQCGLALSTGEGPGKLGKTGFPLPACAGTSFVGMAKPQQAAGN